MLVIFYLKLFIILNYNYVIPIIAHPNRGACDVWTGSMQRVSITAANQAAPSACLIQTRPTSLPGTVDFALLSVSVWLFN